MRIQECSVPLCLQRLGISFFLCLGLVPTARAQYQFEIIPHSQAPATSGVLSLSDCIQIGLAQQPTIAAQRSSIASSEAARRALDNMFCFSLISPELKYRKEQASLGIAIGYAGLEVAERETTYAITRCYCSVVYARKQEALAKQLMEKLDLARRNAMALVKKGDPDVQVTQVDVEKLSINMDLLQLRLIEASTGIERATAALREAMGLQYDTPLTTASTDLPEMNDTPDRGFIVHLALSRRGEMIQAQNAAAMTELEVCAQNSGCFLPFKSTFAAAGDIHAKSIPQGTNNGTYRPSAIGIEMPTKLVGNRTDRMARAQELSYEAGSVVEKTRGLIALESQDAFFKWQSAYGQVKLLRESVAKTAKVADLISGRFDNGKVSGEEFIRARTLEDQTQAQLNEALYNQALALAALERVTAGGFVPSFRTAGAK